MDSTILLRDFEERDIDFVFKCKNDEKLNSMIVGDFRPFTREEATNWVHGCMGEHETYKFWAICTNNAEKRILGWVSLSQIDKSNRSACHHGLVIGDNEYRDGTAMFEAMLLSMEYAFVTLNIHRLYGCCIAGHKITPHMNYALGYQLEGRRRDALVKDGKYFDLLDYSMLQGEYLNMKRDGAFEMNKMIKKFLHSINKIE